MNKLFAIITVFSFGACSAISPCGDSLFVFLKSKPLDSLSQNEMAYFLSMNQQCNTYPLPEKKATENPTKETSNNPATAVAVIVFAAIILPIVIVLASRTVAKNRAQQIENSAVTNQL